MLNSEVSKIISCYYNSSEYWLISIEILYSLWRCNYTLTVTDLNSTQEYIYHDTLPSQSRSQWLPKEGSYVPLKDVLAGLTLNLSVRSLVSYESLLPTRCPWISFSFHYSSNNKGGLLVHFWIVFVMPHAKTHIFCEDCVAAILKDSIQTSIINRTSVGSLQGLAVDMDSVVLNGDCWWLIPL